MQLQTSMLENQIGAVLFGKGDGPRLGNPFWLVWRENGRALQSGWHEVETLRAAIAQAEEGVRAQATHLELCLTDGYREVSGKDFDVRFPASARGRLGLEIRHREALLRIAPTRTIATNRGFRRELDRFAMRSGESSANLLQAARIRSFEARQFLITLSAPGKVHELYRGSRIVAFQEVDRDLLQATISDLCTWLRENLKRDGRMTYKYWPSSGEESQANNTIRQFMATVALGRIAARSQSASDAEAARRNLGYNLSAFYREIEGVGVIIWDDKAKLGAIALAALAILEFRQAGLIDPRHYRDEFDGLCRAVDALWQANGSFRTFLVPAERNDNQNFYPGEALLFWASLYRANQDDALLGKCIRSFSYYRDWHLREPNPAFVPWHSQAYVMLYEDTSNAELATFVLDRNEWLLAMQQWDMTIAPDFRGRFYDPRHPEYGPPHASATGVYMEGLADAWRLARSHGDRREENFALALRRGLRNVRQLQFVDPEIDAFYVHRKAAVMGGLRTETYNNEIRVDNVQHCLMALLKIEHESDFPW
ncbi:hypothetical protein G5V57_33520 [Nordella sp. HKS 07]|uniref:hypothetical protein n=1 Tax=Nordella sp. HKS 07 TaxID=2712222 RepID=UPI0013E12ABB|nr:hypothetical protein [Nordella sp. HKS 07]QIG52190.1 hypothetical protein G5V57_33520 [Nordella sp. HKS 07]